MEQLQSVAKRCHLLQLPDELKLEIVKHVRDRRDLYHFSLACRSLEDMTLSRLYKSIDLEIPASESPSWNQSALPTFRPYVLQNMRELVVRNGVSDTKNPVYNKRRRSDANTMEGYVSEIFSGIPQDRLQSLSFQHRAPVTKQMLTELAHHQGNSLKHLQCCELEFLHKPDTSLPSNLYSLECRSVLSGEAITKLIEANKNTLRSLSLGQDKYLLQQYRQRRIGFLSNVSQPFNTFNAILDLSMMPNLKHLSFTGLDLGPLIPRTQESFLCFTQLESLTIESCSNIAEFLDAVTSIFTRAKESGIKPSLSKFSIRNEFFTAPSKDALLNFLTSFAGLRSLTILIENATMTARPSTFLATHGTTLEYLTLESRIQPRSHLHIDTSRPFGSSSQGATQSQLWLDTITDITKLCPNLTELGTAIPWDDNTLPSQLSHLTSLKSLKTLHIRNFPTSQNLTTLGPIALKSHAKDILAWTSPSTLETLAIGPTVYVSRWRLFPSATTSSSPQTNTQTFTPRSSIRPIPVHPSQLHGSTAQRRLHAAVAAAALMKREKGYTSPPEYLCTHYFSVHNGDLEAVSERKMEEQRGRGVGGVFEGIWLR